MVLLGLLVIGGGDGVGGVCNVIVSYLFVVVWNSYYMLISNLSFIESPLFCLFSQIPPYIFKQSLCPYLWWPVINY